MIRSSWLPPTGLMPTGRVYMFAVFMSEAALTRSAPLLDFAPGAIEPE
jgi:hypothetical protein